MTDLRTEPHGPATHPLILPWRWHRAGAVQWDARCIQGA